MSLKSEKVEVYQLYGEGAVNDLSRALEVFLNDGWELKFANLASVDANQTRFRGSYVLTRVVSVAPVFVPGKEKVESDSVLDAVKEGKVGKKVEK
jgi:hypothetical protein